MLKELTLSAVEPVLVNVTVCAADVKPTYVVGNPRVPGENETGDGGAESVPVTVRACWLPGAFSVSEVIVTLSLKSTDEPLPGCVTGEKSMVRLQLPAIASGVLAKQSPVAELASGKSVG
jgi:hypothetical protein